MSPTTAVRRTVTIQTSSGPVVLHDYTADQGCWFGLLAGALVYSPGLASGAAPTDDGDLGEVDFFSIDDDVALRCRAAQVDLLELARPLLERFIFLARRANEGDALCLHNMLYAAHEAAELIGYQEDDS